MTDRRRRLAPLRRRPQREKGWRALTLALAFTACGFAFAGCGGVDRESQVRRNLRLLASLPAYPGAVVTRTHSYAQYETADGDTVSGIVGYATTRAYRAPRVSTPEKIFRFYRRRLAGWRLASVEHQIGPPGTPHWGLYATFGRGDATFSIGIPESPSGRIFRIGVHYRDNSG